MPYLAQVFDYTLSDNQRIRAIQCAIEQTKEWLSDIEVSFDLMEEGVDDEETLYDAKDSALSRLEFLRQELKDAREIRRNRLAREKAKKEKERKAKERKEKREQKANKNKTT